MDKEKLYNAVDFMLDGDLINFNKTIKDTLETKAQEALDAAIHVVRSDMYNFTDETSKEIENK